MVLVLAAALAVALFLLWRQRAAARAVGEKPAQAAATTVTLNVTAFPATARLYLDDEATASNPLFRIVARDDRTHRIEARAAGYASESRSVRFDENANIVLKLSALAAAPIAASALPAASPPSWKAPVGKLRVVAQPAASHDAKPSVDCSQPYTLDSAGVKRFKPECL